MSLTPEKKDALNKYLEENQMMIVISIPSSTYELNMDIKFSASDIDNKIHKAHSTLNLKEIVNCRQDYLMLDPDDDAFDRYVLTPEGEEYLKKLQEEKEYE